MTRLELRTENLRILELKLQNALDGLKEAEAKNKDDIISAFQDSVLNRFGPFYEITWKFLKDFLEQQHIDIIPSPKKIFHACQAHGIITQQEADTLGEIIGFQIKGVYGFDEELTTEFAQKIAKTYFPTMQAVINRLAAR